MEERETKKQESFRAAWRARMGEYNSRAASGKKIPNNGDTFSDAYRGLSSYDHIVWESGKMLTAAWT